MKKLKEVTSSEMGKLIYCSEIPKNSFFGKRGVNYAMVIIILIITLLLFIVQQLFFLVIFIIMSFFMLFLFNWFIYRNKFDIYENGFIAKIHVRPEDPDIIFESAIGLLRFIKYSEIKKIYRIGRNKTKKIIKDDIVPVRIDIEPIYKRYSIIVPYWENMNIITKLISQIQKKKIKVEIDKGLLDLTRVKR